MKIALIVVGVIAIAVIGIEIAGTIAYRRWRRRFDSLPPAERRKEQERLYKVEAWRS